MTQHSNAIKGGEWIASIPDTINSLENFFGSVPSDKKIRICTTDYDVSIKSSRSKVLETLSFAEAMGVIKTSLIKYDPSFLCRKTRDVMKYMNLDYKQSDPSLSILEYGKTMWSQQLTRPQLQAYATGNLDEATCYLLARFYFTTDTVDGFMNSCFDDSGCTLSHEFYIKVIKT